MAAFIKRILFFLLPLLLVFSFPVFVYWRSGEFKTIDQAVESQLHPGPVLVGYAYSGGAGLKFKSILKRKPEILVLGTSRAMEFRGMFFNKKPEAFFNAGGSMAVLGQFKKFLASIPDSALPKVLIASLDQNFFNANWDPPVDELDYKERGLKGSSETQRLFSLIFQQWPSVYRDFWRHKYTLANLDSAVSPYPGVAAIGLSARVYGEGDLNDGSRVYGTRWLDLKQDWDPGFKETFLRIAKANGRFEYGQEVSKKALGLLRELLMFCRSKGIHVAAYLPPYAPKVFSKMALMPEYGYMRELPRAVSAVFSEFEASVFDFTDVRALGATDEEFIDGFHGSDTTYARMLIQMAKKDRRVAQYTDPHHLEQLIAGRKGSMQIFNPVASDDIPLCSKAATRCRTSQNGVFELVENRAGGKLWRDLRTGYFWSEPLSSDSNQGDAAAACRAMSRRHWLSGKLFWLPSRAEFESVNANGFLELAPNSGNQWFWTSTRFESNNDTNQPDFMHMRSSDGVFDHADPNRVDHVRCVGRNILF